MAASKHNLPSRQAKAARPVAFKKKIDRLFDIDTDIDFIVTLFDKIMGEGKDALKNGQYVNVHVKTKQRFCEFIMGELNESKELQVIEKKYVLMFYLKLLMTHAKSIRISSGKTRIGKGEIDKFMKIYFLYFPAEEKIQ